MNNCSQKKDSYEFMPSNCCINVNPQRFCLCPYPWRCSCVFSRKESLLSMFIYVQPPKCEILQQQQQQPQPTTTYHNQPPPPAILVENMVSGSAFIQIGNFRLGDGDGRHFTLSHKAGRSLQQRWVAIFWCSKDVRFIQQKKQTVIWFEMLILIHSLKLRLKLLLLPRVLGLPLLVKLWC